MSSQSVLVIGGGLAGLSSAVALAEAGLHVRLLEKRPRLGGRATSYALPDGTEVDNCQHVTLGCCTNLADFYRRVGAGEAIRFYDCLFFADSHGRRSIIRASWLPPPLHMAPSFLFFRALAFADKRCIAKALFAIARAGGELPQAAGSSMLDWLHRMKQTPAAIDRFWRVVLVSALDEELVRTDARYGVEVFWKAFLAAHGGYRVGIPSVPLGELYGGCREAVLRGGGEVRLSCGVREIKVRDGRFAGAVLTDGSELSADACVVAVPHQVLLDLLPKEMGESGALFGALRHMKAAPITSVHLWFDRKIMEEPFLALLDHTTQWIFNKTLLSSARQTNGTNRSSTSRPDSAEPVEGQYLQLVVSASYDLVRRSRQEIVDLCLRELRQVVPSACDAKLLKATVIKELNATFSPEPGVDRWRPPQDVGIKNFLLAGDWTRTGWPATMEGAVRSGYLAAEALLAGLGTSRKFLQPELPPEGLCKFWAKKSESGEA